MKCPQPGVEPLIKIILPLGAAGVAEEDPAAERSDFMNATEFSTLKRATSFYLVLIENTVVAALPPIVEKTGQFHRSDIQAMPEFLEPTASTRSDADGSAQIDFGLKFTINAGNRVPHVRTRCRRTNARR